MAKKLNDTQLKALASVRHTFPISKVLNPISEIDLAWLTGLLEGEGSFGFRMTKDQHGNISGRLVISCGMTDKDIIERVHTLIPQGRTGYYDSSKGYKRVYRFQLSSSPLCVDLMRLLLPQMGQRRQEQIRSALFQWSAYKSGLTQARFFRLAGFIPSLSDKLEE